MYQVDNLSDATVVHVRDDLDIGARRAFEAVLATAIADATRRVIVSLEACPYCDSTGLSVLVSVQKRIGSLLTVVVPETGLCRRIFTVSGLDKFIRCVPTLDAALASEPV